MAALYRSNLALELGTAEHEATIGAVAQRPRQLGSEFVLEQLTIHGEKGCLGACQLAAQRDAA